MVKKAIVEVVLIPESVNVKSKDIELDIRNALRRGDLIIPWCYKVENVRVVEIK
ncbi:MAG: hypothetical protein ACPLW8_03525 [Candidatus Bathyarchaeales archaeon]